jgi:hypothetical protein
MIGVQRVDSQQVLQRRQVKIAEQSLNFMRRMLLAGEAGLLFTLG